MDQVDEHLAVVEPGPITDDGRQTWSARCSRCATRVGGCTRAVAEAWKDGHDVAARRHDRFGATAR